MCKKYATLLCFLCALVVFSPRVSAQDTTSDDAQIVENQQEILSILPGLIELSLLREADLSKKEQISNEREQALSTKESDLQKREQALSTKENELQKKEQSISARETELSQSEKDMQTLKDSVVTLSESYKLEVQKGLWKNRGIVVLASCLAGSIIYAILK